MQPKRLFWYLNDISNLNIMVGNFQLGKYSTNFKTNNNFETVIVVAAIVILGVVAIKEYNKTKVLIGGGIQPMLNS